MKDVIRWFKSIRKNLAQNWTILECYDILNDLKNDYGFYVEMDKSTSLETDGCYLELERVLAKIEKIINE